MLKKIIIFSAFFAIISKNSHAQTENLYLPDSIKQTMRTSCLTKDAFIMASVRDSFIKQYPSLAQSIQTYSASDCQKEEEIIKEKPERKKGWESSIDAGISMSRGNTKRDSINANFKTTYEQEFWKTTFTGRVINQKENNNRIAENYRANLNGRYKLTDDDYIFAEGEYVKDRFSGFDYRISENLGYGRVFIKNDITNLEAEASIGARQSQLSTNEKQNSAIQKDTVRFNHKLTQSVIFSEIASISLGDDAIISESTTSIKTQLTKDLYLNFSLYAQHISTVTIGKKKTDTLTTVNLGYSF